MKTAVTRLAVFLLLSVGAVAQADANARGETTPALPGGPLVGWDTAVWVHPTNRQLSMVFGTDQMNTAGLRSYGLSGAQIDFYNTGSARGVDVAYDVSLSTGRVDVLALAALAGELKLFAISPVDRTLKPVGTAVLAAVPTAVATWVEPSNHRLTVFISEASQIRKLVFTESTTAPGTLEAADLGTISIGTGTANGIVSDEANGVIYYTTTGGTLGKATYMPFAATTPIDTIGQNAGGLAKYLQADGGLTLLAALQNNSVAVYHPTSMSAETDFQLLRTAGSTAPINGTPFNLDLVGAALPGFGSGLLVGLDNQNPGGPNFKLYAWDDVVAGSVPHLSVNAVETGPWLGRDAGLPPPSDGGATDGGSDAGTSDGGTDGGVILLPDGGLPDGGTVPKPGGSGGTIGGGGGVDPEPEGCGCTSMAGWPLALAALLWRRRFGRR